MTLWAHVFLCAAALCGGALSDYVDVDQSILQHYGGGHRQLSSTGPNCDFDGSTTCSWTASVHPGGNHWRFKNGGTPSSGTGPSGTASGSGYYIYMEASNPSKKGDQLKLTRDFNAGARCMTFMYHMLGAHMGSLEVSVVENAKDVTLFSKTGNQGNIWTTQKLTVKSPRAHTVRFTGTVGRGWSGDIALDSISFVDGSCPGTDPTTNPPLPPSTVSPSTNPPLPPSTVAPTTKAPLPPSTTAPPFPPQTVNCKFDLGNMCAWQAPKNSAGNGWKLNTGSTPSSGTGPSNDVSGKGKYIFMEASSFKRGQIVRLISPTFRAGSQCLHFHYHMYGKSMGQLKVDIAIGSSRRTLFSERGDHGNKWINDSVAITQTQDYKIEIVGVLGTGWTGDMAVDEIKFTPKCPTPPNTCAPTTLGPATLPPSDTCGRRQPGRFLGVIGGYDAKRGDWPWQILLMKYGRGGCGGSLISDRWVVTAAHCVYQDKRARVYKVRVGETDQYKKEGSEVDHQVKRIIVHPKFNRLYIRDDIALLELQKPVTCNKYVQPICLPKHDAPIGSRNCYITGWGKIRFPGNGHPKLQQAVLPPVDSKVCEKKNQKIQSLKHVNITAGMLCGGEGGINPISGCHGDSGGPYVCEENGQWYLHGAVSHGSPYCDSRETYSVFARVNYFKTWINDMIKKYA